MSQTPDNPTASPSPAGEIRPLRGRSLWADARRRLLRDKGAVACLIVVAVYALIAVGAAVYDHLADGTATPLQQRLLSFQEMKDPDHTYQPPSTSSWRTWLGTDWYGRPVWVETLYGAKVSLTVGLMSNIIAIPLGIFLGAVAGYFGRWLDDFIVWIYSTLACIPGLVLLIAVKFAFKGTTFLGLDLSGIHGIYLALGITSWVGTCRLVRAETMKLRELDYVLAARASGRGGLAILLRHILPNVAHIGIINFSLGFVGGVQSEVMLSFLGLGVEEGTPSWGSMINGARMDLFAGRWWELTAAVTAMFVLVLALNILGDRLRDALDPRLRNL